MPRLMIKKSRSFEYFKDIRFVNQVTLSNEDTVSISSVESKQLLNSSEFSSKCVTPTKYLNISASQPFPKQLMKILHRKEHEHIISWSSEGKSFNIHDKNKLIRIFSESYFQDTKYESFRRKLHRWGFKTIKKGSEAGNYFHKLFIRDDPLLCSLMSCQKRKMKNPLKRKLKKKVEKLSNTYKFDPVNASGTELLNESLIQKLGKQNFNIQNSSQKEKACFFYDKVQFSISLEWQNKRHGLKKTLFFRKYIEETKSSFKIDQHINKSQVNLSFNSEGLNIKNQVIAAKIS